MQAALRDKLLQDHSVLAAFLTGLRMYLEDPTKVPHLLLSSLCFLECSVISSVITRCSKACFVTVVPASLCSLQHVCIASCTHCM